MRLKFGRAVNDPEKLVLPGIIYCSKREGGISAYIIAAGWWDFHVSLIWSRKDHP